jgi:hypothetical protein
MSNNDDFDFNRDDLFDDFDNDSGGDDFGGDDFNSDDFDFGDDSEDFNIDDDNSFSDIDSALADDDDFGGGDDFGSDEPAATGGGGSNRNFIFGVIALLLVFAVGIGLIVWLSTREDPTVTAFNATRDAIFTQNAIAETDIAASSTAAVDQATGTQSAIETATAGFTPASETPTPSPSPTEDLTATALEQQNQQIFQQQTVDAQAAIDATNTEISFQQTLNPQATVPTLEVTTDAGAPTSEATVSISSVQQTATALAILFSTPPTQSGAQPTSIIDGGTPIVIGGATVTPGGTIVDNGELPDTGLFDDVFQGNPTFIFVAAFGLLGVIVVSRTVRSRKRHDD